jgi:hypothetical protein
MGVRVGETAAGGGGRRWRGVGAVALVGAASALVVATLATTATRVAATSVPAPPAGWTTAFSDSFSGAAGSGVDSQWTYDVGTQYSGTGCTGSWGTGEVESDTSSSANVSEDGRGHLDITPLRSSGGAWTSGRLETVADSFAAPAGGEMEVSASIEQPNPSSGVGYWPAFWMLGDGFRASGAGTSGTMDCASWPSVGEIDIMEDVNGLSEHSGTLHCGTDPGGPCNETTGLGSGLQACSGCQTGYHTYSVIVNRTDSSDESITWYLDGTAYFTVSESQVGTSTWQAAVDHGFFLILDVAIGGGYPNAICGCTSPSGSTTSGAGMSVGYVAVYTTASGGTPTPTPTPTGTPTPTATARPSCSSTASSPISADCFTSSQGSISVTSTSDPDPAGVDSNQVYQLRNGDWLGYPGIDFGSGSTQLDARVASGAAGGVSGLVEVVLDNPANPSIGSFAVGNTGGWSSWETIPANISTVTGTHTVYLVFSSGAGGSPPYVSLHYFDFPSSGGGGTPTPTPTPTPSPSCPSSATADISADCFSASQGSITVTSTSDPDPAGVDGNQAYQLSNGDWLEYPGIDFGSGSTQFDARVASGAAGGVSGLVEVVLDNPANPPVGSFAVGSTGGWSSWKTIPANISTVTGTHTVYLVFSSGAGGNPPFVSLHYFSFPAS